LAPWPVGKENEETEHEVVTRHRNLHAQGVDIRLQEEEARDGPHTAETLGVLVTPRRDVTIGLGRVENVTHLWKAFAFETRMDASPVVLTTLETFNGQNTAAPRLRNLSPSGAEVFVEEEASQDQEMRHKEETISIIAVPSGRFRNKTGDFIGEAGTLQTDQPGRDHWHALTFDERYSAPVVFMQIMTYNGGNPAHIRLRNVNANSCEFQIEEWNYLNGKHVEETIGYIVVEKGIHELSDGAHLHVGTTQATHAWSNEVGFTPDYQNTQPVLITQCQTRNGTHEVVIRTRNLDAHGFEVRVQEEQARDGEHTGETIGFLSIARPGRMVPEYQAEEVPQVKVSNFHPKTCGFRFQNSFPAGQYTLPNPISIGPITINEIGDTTNGMCGGMVFAARDYYEYGHSPWPEDLLNRRPPNSPVSRSVPDEDSKLFNFLSERLFDSFKPGDGNTLGAALYQTLMNSANTKKWGQVKKSRNEVMKEQWENTIKPTLDSDNPCPLGLIHVDTHGKPFKTGLNQLGNNHQVLAYGYTQSGNVIEIYVYDPNDPRNGDMRIQFEIKNDLSNWFEPTYIGSSKPLYAFFAPSYSAKEPPAF
jgi:hypothetical protein